MSTITLTSVPMPKTPRGAKLVAIVYDALAHVAARLEAGRAARARRTRTEEAEEVRRFARDVQDSDPGFAADLFAAADRHVTQ
jgi:hypothetical protein